MVRTFGGWREGLLAFSLLGTFLIGYAFIGAIERRGPPSNCPSGPKTPIELCGGEFIFPRASYKRLQISSSFVIIKLFIEDMPGFSSVSVWTRMTTSSHTSRRYICLWKYWVCTTDQSIHSHWTLSQMHSSQTFASWILYSVFIRYEHYQQGNCV